MGRFNRLAEIVSQFSGLIHSPFSHLGGQERKQARMLRPITLSFFIASTLLATIYITMEATGPLQYGVLSLLLALALASAILTYQQRLRAGLGLLLMGLVLIYLFIPVVFARPESAYSLSFMVCITVFVTSLFTPPRVVGALSIVALFVLISGGIWSLWLPTVVEATLLIVPPIFLLEVILFASYARHENNNLVNQQTEALIESESRFRSLFDQTFQFAGFMQADGFIIDINEKATRMLAFIGEVGIGRYLWDVLPWQESDRHVSQVQLDVQRAAKGEVVHFEVTFAGEMGKRHIFEVWLRPVYDETDKVYLIAVIGQDVTTLKRAEQKRDLEAFRYKSLFESMGDGSIIIGVDQNIRAINPAGSQLLGYTPPELQGVYLKTLLPDEDEWTDSRKQLEAIHDGKQIGLTRRTFRRKDGTSLNVELHPTLVRDNQGNPLYIQAVFRDLSVREEAERHRLEVGIERERIRILSQFLTDISHDLRTPISNIQTSTYLLSRTLKQSPDKSPRYLEVIDEALEQLNGLIESQLEVIRAEPTTDQGATFDVNLNEVMRHVVLSLQEEATSKGISLSFSSATPAPILRADNDRIALAVRQVVQNALQFTEAGGSVELSITEQQHTVQLSVKDTGIGIHLHDLPHIFESHYRADHARQEKRAGLGLPIANRIVSAYGGRIHVESNPGVGSRFTFHFPKQDHMTLQAD